MLLHQPHQLATANVTLQLPVQTHKDLSHIKLTQYHQPLHHLTHPLPLVLITPQSPLNKPLIDLIFEEQSHEHLLSELTLLLLLLDLVEQLLLLVHLVLIDETDANHL